MKRIEQFEMDGTIISAEFFGNQPLQNAGRDFKNQLEIMVPVIKAAKEKIDSLENFKPSEVALEFGISLSAEAGIIVAKGAIEATLTVSVTWTLD
jgi:hypothetical protein